MDNNDNDINEETATNQIGQLTPDEQRHLLDIRQESQRHLAKIGEYEVLKSRLISRVNILDQQGQDAINAISKRLNLEDGQQWVALQDGTIRLVGTGEAVSPQQEGAEE
jgi:hypothetical protein